MKTSTSIFLLLTACFQKTDYNCLFGLEKDLIQFSFNKINYTKSLIPIDAFSNPGLNDRA